MPQYSEITDATPAEYIDLNMTFFIKCSALGFQSIGGGVTKKMAKHSSAEKLLSQLQQGVGEIDIPSYNQSLESDAITELFDYCTIRNFHRPEFNCVSIYGPTHDPSFTFEGRLDSVVETATAGTKQLAKQLSAKAVLDVIKQVSHSRVINQSKVLYNCEIYFFRAILTQRRDLPISTSRHQLKLLVRKSPAIEN